MRKNAKVALHLLGTATKLIERHQLKESEQGYIDSDLDQCLYEIISEICRLVIKRVETLKIEKYD